jgi:hypothetical protein
MNAYTGILLIDDLRTAEDAIYQSGVSTISKIARTFDEAIKSLDRGLPWKTVILDHDLASYDENGSEKTGYDVVKWLSEHQEALPQQVYLITSSPVGLNNMGSLLERIGYIKKTPRAFFLGDKHEDAS